MARRSSSIRSGLRTVARTPALWLAEIVWRWAFSVGTLLLLALAGLQFARWLRISSADLALLRTQDPWLVAGTLANIFQGTGGRLLRIIAVLIPAVGLFWTFAAAAGRAATLNVLLRAPVIRWRGLLGLSFLRAAATLAAIVGFLGAALLAGYSTEPAADAGRAIAQAQRLAVLFAVLGIAVLAAWALLNWVLSLAAVFAARNRPGAMSAIGETLRMVYKYLGEFLAVSAWFGLWHALLLLIAGVAAGGVLAAAGPSGLTVGLAIAIALVYFALVDFLYIARLAAYVAIVDGPLAQPPIPASQDAVVP